VKAGDPVIEIATEKEFPALLELQKRAFWTAAALCGDYSSPPLTQTLEELVEECRSSFVLIARMGGELVGTVRSRREGKTCHVARLAVHPEYRRRGIARRLLAELERHAEVEDQAPTRFELFTAQADGGTIALYRSIGYRIFRTVRPVSLPALVYMEKVVVPR
jgi:ribosomal protein S18 acetylase RimI-like enzyme